MMNRIIKFSLENKCLILLSAVLIMPLGHFTTLNIDVDVFPGATGPVQLQH